MDPPYYLNPSGQQAKDEGDRNAIPLNAYMADAAPSGFVCAADLEGPNISNDNSVFGFFDGHDLNTITDCDNTVQPIAAPEPDLYPRQEHGNDRRETRHQLRPATTFSEDRNHGHVSYQLPDLDQVWDFVNETAATSVQDQLHPACENNVGQQHAGAPSASATPIQGHSYPVHRHAGEQQNTATQTLGVANTPSRVHQYYSPNACSNLNLAAWRPEPGLARLNEIYGRISRESYDRTITRLLSVAPTPGLAAPTAQIPGLGNSKRRIDQHSEFDANIPGLIGQRQADQTLGHDAAQERVVDLAAYLRWQRQNQIYMQSDPQEPANTLTYGGSAEQSDNKGHNEQVNGELAIEDVTATDGRSRGKLQLVEVGQGKCTFRSKQNNICGRNAPMLETVNGPRERFCMCTSKHLPQWRRSHALLPAIKLIPKTLAQAKAEIYPVHTPLAQEHLYRDPTLQTEAGQQLKWQKRFLAAALAPYDGPIKKLQDQQSYFNGNVECDTEGHYSEDQVNSRIALLYHIAWNVHVGGERLYAIFGDNDGYPKEHRRLSFLRRLETIEQLLRTNKRIVLDVIQGRGVGAFVETPHAFDKRKATNNTNNENKKREAPTDDEGHGPDFDDEGQDTPTPPPRKKRKPTRQANAGKKEVTATESASATIEWKPIAPPRHFYGTYVPGSPGSATAQKSSKETTEDDKLSTATNRLSAVATQDSSAAGDGNIENEGGSGIDWIAIDWDSIDLDNTDSLLFELKNGARCS